MRLTPSIRNAAANGPTLPAPGGKYMVGNLADYNWGLKAELLGAKLV